MKKFLLSAAAIFAAMSINAQEYCAFNADENSDFAALGLSGDAISVDGGSVIGKTDHITATIGADDSYKSSSLGSVVVNGTSMNGGLQGSTNPKDADGTPPANSLLAPVSGAFYVFEATADGYLYVFHKASSNKSYTVFEEGSPIGYTFAAVGDGDRLGAVYGYTLTGTLEIEGVGGYLQASDLTGGIMQWAEKIFLNYDGESEWTNVAKGGMSVIKFPVFEGCKYIVNANGSKMSASAFYFDTTGDANVTTSVDGEDVSLLVNGQYPGTSGINAIAAEKAQNNAAYNLAGQRVNKNADGIIMINGKKYINK